MTSGLLLPGSCGVQARVGPAGKKISLTWELSWAGMDVPKQVNMEPPPQCQLSQSAFFLYLTLSPRARGEGQEGILLPGVQGMAGWESPASGGAWGAAQGTHSPRRE